VAVDFATLFQTFYPPGPGRQYVNPSTGSDSNAGTAGSPKRTISAAQSALGSAGGIVWCADGVYPSGQVISGTYALNSRLLVMAQNIEGATIVCNSNDGIAISGRGIGVYGFHITGNGDTGSFVYQKCILIYGGATYVSVWKNYCLKGCEAGIGVPSQNLVSDYIDICYNTVEECGRWFFNAGSGISMYECRQADNNPGPHINVIGNRCFHNYNNTSTANTDGNGIIIDDFFNSQNGYSNDHRGLVVVAGNLCVDNGGRGTHSPWSTNVWHAFNTCADNMWQVEPGSRGGECAVGGSLSKLNCNVICPDSGRYANGQIVSSYFHTSSDFGGRFIGSYVGDNTALAGSYFGSNDGSVRNRTGEGKNYFKDTTPTLAPRTLELADQWRPEGGSGAVETTVLTQAEYDILSRWPDMFGDYRPARTTGWAHGFAEPSATTPPTGSHPYTGPGSGAGSVVSSSSGGTGYGGTITNVIYRMLGIDGTVINARAVIIVPGGSAPANGRNVIAICHAADGLESGGGIQADSVGGDISTLISSGYVVVCVDNEGLNDSSTGNTKPNPYINRNSAGRGVIDAVRATASLTSISGHVAAWGWSQGGATALAAGELHKQGYGDLHNMLAVAVDAVHPENFVSGYYNQGWAAGYCQGICMGAWYEGRTLNLASIFNGSIASNISAGIYDNFDVESLPGGFITNPTSVTAWATALRTNSFGYVRSSKVLLMPASAGIDGGYVANDAYYNRAVAAGTSIDRTNVSADHSGAPAAAASTARAWIAANIDAEDLSSGSVAPTASFTYSPSSITVGQAVTFSDASAGVPTSWEWAFGDGTGVDLPEPGLNSAGHFSGRILRDGQPLEGVVVKAVNILCSGWPRIPVLDTLGGADGTEVMIDTTDVNGDWSITGLDSGKDYMLKIFPPSLCDAYGEMSNPVYITSEAGYVNDSGNPFMSTRAAPGSDTYAVYGAGRYLFDMPVHVFPAVGGALDGASGYSDLNVLFYTREGSFPTSNGTHSGCTSGAGPTGSTLQNPTHTYTAPGTYVVQLTATNAVGSSTSSQTVTVTAQPTGGGLTLQAEDASLTTAYPGDPYAIHIVAENPGYTGTGYAGYHGQTGEKLTWSFTAPNGAGTYAITFRYRCIEAVTRTVWVNGTSQGTLSLPASASAFTQNSWGTSVTITVALSAGANTLELRHAGANFSGYLDVDSVSLTGGGTAATVVATAIGAVAALPGVSIGTATVVDARPTPPSIACAVGAHSLVGFQATATVTPAAIAATAGIDNTGLYGDIPIIHVTIEAQSIAARAGFPAADIEAMRLLAGRYRLLGNTRQRTTG